MKKRLWTVSTIVLAACAPEAHDGTVNDRSWRASTRKIEVCANGEDAITNVESNGRGRGTGKPPPPKVPAEIDPRRSLIVTEAPILERFSLQRVLEQLVDESDADALTAAELFQQWWDTQNPGPGLGRGPHCDDATDPALGPVLNGFPYDCRPAPAEGAQAACNDPFNDPACQYVPIALVNRFDLAPPSGAHCGEHRIIYGKATGTIDRRDRNLVIFEAALANKHPNQGLRGCRKVVEHWARLSAMEDLDQRADALEELFFFGHKEFAPIVDPHHFGDNVLDAGQIRTNQFMQPRAPVWTLREFKLYGRCTDDACSMQMVPVTNKVNPTGLLFGDPAAEPRVLAFQQSFLDQVPSLAASNLSEIVMRTDDAFNTAQSHSSFSNEMRYPLHYSYAPAGFVKALQARLSALGSTLSPADIVARAQAQSCAGCHQLSNGAPLGDGLVWPESLGFVHVSEIDPETVDGVLRYRISPALTDVFLPARKVLMERFIQENVPPGHVIRPTH